MKRLTTLSIVALVLTACHDPTDPGHPQLPATQLSQVHESATSGLQSRIAFRSSRDGNFEIYVMNADGTNQTRVTNHLAIDALQDWSPDGSKLVFISNRDGVGFEIYVINLDGSGVTRLTTNAVFETAPSWSPDGRGDCHQINPEPSAWCKQPRTPLGRSGLAQPLLLKADLTNPD